MRHTSWYICSHSSCGLTRTFRSARLSAPSPGFTGALAGAMTHVGGPPPPGPASPFSGPCRRSPAASFRRWRRARSSRTCSASFSVFLSSSVHRLSVAPRSPKRPEPGSRGSRGSLSARRQARVYAAGGSGKRHDARLDSRQVHLDGLHRRRLCRHWPSRRLRPPSLPRRPSPSSFFASSFSAGFSSSSSGAMGEAWLAASTSA